MGNNNCVGTYEAYKARLLKMKPNVYLHGQKVDRSNGKEGAERDLADWITGGTYVMTQCYDTANDPAYADVCLAESKIPGMEDVYKRQMLDRVANMALVMAPNLMPQPLMPSSPPPSS